MAQTPRLASPTAPPPSAQMKREPNIKVLLFSADDRHQAEVAEGWKASVKSATGSHSFDLVHHDCLEATNIIVIMDILDRISLGVFDIVAVIPPWSTWSRARHADTEGQKPLRSRSHPLGLPALTESAQQKVDKANENLELALWISLQTLRCTVKPVELLFVAPEDFGGHATNGPASVWQFREVQDLGAFNEAQRAAGFLCQLSRADQKRPLGFVSTLLSFTQLLCAGWPNLELKGEYLQYTGPLPKDCPCASPHTAMVGLSKDSTFMSSISPTLGILFWTNIWKAYMEPFSLRDGEEHIQKGPFQYDHSLPSRSGSWFSLLCLWRNSGLNRAVLRDWAEPEQAELYFSTDAPCSLASSTRSLLW